MSGPYTAIAALGQACLTGVSQVEVRGAEGAVGNVPSDWGNALCLLFTFSAYDILCVVMIGYDQQYS